MKALAADNVHETAMALLDVGKDAMIGDIPCGEGALTVRLLAAGFDNVWAADINIEQIKISDPRVTPIRVDLLRGVDLPDSTFDAIMCLECIEHLENPYHLMREMARLLKPGGMLVLSTPNVLSVNARSKYLSAGYWPHFTELMTCKSRALQGLGFQGHIMPIPLGMLHHLAFLNGFSVEAIATNHFKRRPRWKDRFFARIIRTLSRRFLEPGPWSQITSDAVLYGDIIVVRLRRLVAETCNS